MRRMIESAVTLLPQPLSPTTPSTSPRSMCRLMPSTARAGPRLVRNSTRRSSTVRSEEHTSELQSRFDIVCRLLLEKKKNIKSDLTFTKNKNKHNKQLQPVDHI